MKEFLIATSSNIIVFMVSTIWQDGGWLHGSIAAVTSISSGVAFYLLATWWNNRAERKRSQKREEKKQAAFVLLGNLSSDTLKMVQMLARDYGESWASDSVCTSLRMGFNGNKAFYEALECGLVECIGSNVRLSPECVALLRDAEIMNK